MGARSGGAPATLQSGISPPPPALLSGSRRGKEQPSVGSWQRPRGFSPNTSLMPVDKSLAGRPGAVTAQLLGKVQMGMRRPVSAGAPVG